MSFFLPGGYEQLEYKGNPALFAPFHGSQMSQPQEFFKINESSTLDGLPFADWLGQLIKHEAEQCWIVSN